MTEKMKDSGIEWIGEIPEEWEISKIKFEVETIGSGTTPSSDNLLYYDEGIYNWIQSGDLYKKNYILSTEKQLTNVAIKDYKILTKYKKDFVVIAMYGASVGNVSLSKIDAYTNQACCAIKVDYSNNLKYLFFLLKVANEDMLSRAFGGTQPNISQIVIKNMTFLKPSITEQQAISNFLDKKVGQIDDILEDLNKQVEILNQYRDSVIYEATSKGLNKNNVYQNIDNEWYPQIPAHWRFMAVKRLTSVLTCGVASTPEYVDENNGVLFLSAQNIQNNKLDLSIKKYIPISLHKTLTKNRKPEKGDILQVRVGATIGKCAIVDIDEEFSVYVSLSHIRVNHNMHNRFLNYIIGTDMFKEMVSLDIDYAGTQGNLNVADLREVRIPVPPIQEQEAIADYLDKKCTQIDELITDKQKQIEKMENYKKALIYEYVTGKKRVGV